jgi:hypothetical protein
MTWHPRATAALGIGYLVLTTTGLVLAPMLDLGASESAARHYARTVDTTSFIAGAYLQVVAFVTLLVFVLRLSAQAHPVVGRLAAAGATFALACVGSAMAMSGGVVLHHTAIAPATAAVLMDVASLLTWTSLIGLAVALGAVGSATLTSRELPRWMGWSAIGTALGLAASVPLADIGVAHIPAGLFDLWVLVAAVMFLARPGRGRNVSTAGQRVPRPARETVAPPA